MTKNERVRRQELKTYFKQYYANKRELKRIVADKATDNMSVDYAKPAVVSGGGNGQENKTVMIIDREDILRKKVAVVDRTIEHYIGDIEEQDVIRNLLLRNVNVQRYAFMHNKHYTNVYQMIYKILGVANRWASFYHLTQDSYGSDDGNMFATKIEKI